MELFAVNRYDENLDKSKSDENEILQKLLKKVEKRKRRHSETKKKEDKLVTHDQERDTTSKDNNVERDNDLLTKEDDLIDEDIINEGTRGDDQVDNEEPTNTFQVLGEDSDAKKREKIYAVLPSWLAHPTIISTSVGPTSEIPDDSLSQMKFLSPQIRGALKEMKITRLFPVQSTVIPWILEAHRKPPPFLPRDVCVSAPTGSGKTLAFAIPVVQILSPRVVRKIRALVILPVAELALQVFRVFKKLCEHTDLSVCLLSNLTPLAMEKEKLVEMYKGNWYSKVDIVVSTPGRLVEHLHSTDGFCLKSLKFLVIDEADRIMDAVFHNWLYHLHAHVRNTSDQLLSGQSIPLCYNELELAWANHQPHKLLFSATLSQDPEKLQNMRLFQPKLFTSVLSNLEEMQTKFAEHVEKKALEARNGDFIGKYTTPAELTEKFCLTQSRLKPLTLYALIKENKWQKFLCFTNSVEAAGRLAFVLKSLFAKDEDEIRIAELSSAKMQGGKKTFLEKFRKGQINGLICSDALARGIDIPDVDIVISYDPPRHIKTYIHRIGRTARAGKLGTAITLLSPQEQEKFNKLLSDVGKFISEEQTSSTAIEEANARKYQEALEQLREKIAKDKRIRILEINRTRELKELTTKDTSSMTVMEKLQMQATLDMHAKTDIPKESLLVGKRQVNKMLKLAKKGEDVDLSNSSKNKVKAKFDKIKGPKGVSKPSKSMKNFNHKAKKNSFKAKKPKGQTSET
ncbi:putative ATP-dependent RNA helicase Dbp73D [Haematobia irritans]|uniref:putative ATP-dependent RNA helicase Dbp73D n=1 Tax=Haematobia irritans TaxID=7368 RepID=UPI003F50BA7C